MDPSRNLWRKLLQWQLRQRHILLACILAGTLFFTGQILTRLRIATDFFDLYPPRHPYIQLYKQFRKMFGTANVLTLIVEVKRGDIYNLQTIAKIDRLTKRLLQIKGVNPLQVISLTHPKLKQVGVGEFGVHVSPVVWPRIPETDEDLARLKATIYTNEGIRGIHVSLDDKAAVIRAGFWEEGVDLNVLYGEMIRLQEEEQDEDHLIYITGYPMLYAWIAHYAKQIYTVFLLTALVLALLLALYFRTVLGTLVPLVSGLLSALWGLGFAATLGNTVDPLILVVPLLLSARALSHSVQCLERYHEECATGSGDKYEAIISAYSSLYRPALLSIVTDGLGVLTIAVCTIPIMQKLAFAASFWVISIYVSVVLLNPVIFSFVPMPRPSAPKSSSFSPADSADPTRALHGVHRGAFYARICSSLLYFLTGWRRWAVLVLVLFILSAGGYYASGLRVGDTSAGKAILYPDHPYNIAADKLNRMFVGDSEFIVIAEGKEEGSFKQAESLSVLDDVAEYVATLPHVGGTVTVTDIIKRVFRMFHDGDPKWSMLPDDTSHLAQTLFLFEANMAAGEMDRFVSLPDYKNATVTAYVRDYNNEVVRSLIASARSFIDSHTSEKVDLRLAGGIIGILAAVNEEVEWSYWANMLAIFSMTFLLCSFTFRSVLASLTLIVPLAVSQILSDAFMRLQGIDMNINSLPVAAVGVGVGVDYGIYVLTRLAELYAQHRTYERACHLTLLSTGKAVLFTATTLFAGVIFWAFSNLKFQAEMGLLLGFLMLANMVGGLVVVPALVSILGPERVLRKYRV